MEKLTGKCKEDFEAYLKKEYSHFLMRSGESKTYLYDLLKASHIEKINGLLNSVIIEFFDSIRIFISIEYSCLYAGKYFNSMVKNEKYNHEVGNYRTRLEATNEAIKHANKIYNDTK